MSEANKFVWLGTHRIFQAFTFIFVETEFGWFQAHAYRFNHDTSTFIVETTEANWRAAGLDQLDAVGTTDFCERLFSPWLDGHRLLTNMNHLRGSQWLNFPRVANEHWVMGKLVLMGDAAHSAHFSIGSGTKLALEDAIALARAFDKPTSAMCRPRSPLTRQNASWRCCGCSRPLATPPNGSKTSRATCTWSRSSSPTRC